MCQEKLWYNNALVSNWGRNWISTLRLLPYTHTQKFKLKWIKVSNAQNSLNTIGKVYMKIYLCFRLSQSCKWLQYVVADTAEQAKGSAFTIQFLAVCSHWTKQDLKLWLAVWGCVLFCFFLIAIFWWRNVMTWRTGAPRRQQDRWGSGLGIKPWTLS